MNSQCCCKCSCKKKQTVAIVSQDREAAIRHIFKRDGGALIQNNWEFRSSDTTYYILTPNESGVRIKGTMLNEIVLLSYPDIFLRDALFPCLLAGHR